MNDIKLHKQKRMKYDNTVQQSHDVIKRRVCANGTISYGIRHSIFIEGNISYNIDPLREEEVSKEDNETKNQTTEMEQVQENPDTNEEDIEEKDKQLTLVKEKKEKQTQVIQKDCYNEIQSHSNQTMFKMKEEIAKSARSPINRLSKYDLFQLKKALNKKYKLTKKDLPEPFPLLNKISSRLALNQSKGFLNSVMENYNYDYNYQVKEEQVIDAIKVKNRMETKVIDEQKLLEKQINHNKKLNNYLIGMNKDIFKKENHRHSLSISTIPINEPIYETNNQRIIENLHTLKVMKDNLKQYNNSILNQHNSKKTINDDKKSQNNTQFSNWHINDDFMNEYMNKHQLNYQKVKKHKKNYGGSKNSFFITGNVNFQTSRSQFYKSNNDSQMDSLMEIRRNRKESGSKLNIISTCYDINPKEKSIEKSKSKDRSQEKKFEHESIYPYSNINKYKIYNDKIPDFNKYKFQAQISHKNKDRNFLDKISKFIKSREKNNPIALNSLDSLFMANKCSKNEENNAELLNYTNDTNFLPFKHSQRELNSTGKHFMKSKKYSSIGFNKTMTNSVVSSPEKNLYKSNKLFNNSIIKDNLNTNKLKHVNLKLYSSKIKL